ncbi:MAG: tetratricopeptide repeat protein [Spartobacteria bacterium]|nr:tetratricopeptide repeat protein [Spartobacteria bacterium]
MKSRSQDIYGTGRADPASDKLNPSGKIFIPRTIRYTPAGRKGWPSLVFSLVLAVVSMTTGFFVAQRYLTPTGEMNGGATVENRSALVTRTIRTLHEFNPIMDFGTETELLADELADLTPRTLPVQGDPPLDTEWIKQAAYHIVLAEREYEDDAPAKALEHYKKALEIYPGMQGVQANLGLIYLQLKDYPAAQRCFEQATKENEPRQGVFNNLGIAYFQMDDFEKAQEYFEQAISQDPSYSPAYLNLGVLFKEEQRLSEAADFYRRYLEQKPDDFKAAQTLALLLLEQEDWEQAANVLFTIRQFAPELAPVHFRLAQAMLGLDQKEEAIASLHYGARLIDPRKALAWLARPDYDKIRGEEKFRELIQHLSAAEDQ